jgi:hypothetical protein
LSEPDWDMSVLFRAALGFLIAFAVLYPHALAAYFETPAVASLKVDLADAETRETAGFDARTAAPLDAAIAGAANVLHAAARVRASRS